jgi:hypothetical protein
MVLRLGSATLTNQRSVTDIAQGADWRYADRNSTDTRNSDLFIAFYISKRQIYTNDDTLEYICTTKTRHYI